MASPEPEPSIPRQNIIYNGGERIITCGRCSCYLTNSHELMSHRFQGSTGKASLYFRVWNIRCTEKQTRDMMTGKHVVRDVECLRCAYKLGWMYEYAHNEDQRYKEQRVILEVKMCREQDGFCDVETGFKGPYPLVDNEHGGSPVAAVCDEPIATQKHISFRTRTK